MEFLDEFFFDEVISDFYVPSIMKMNWAAQMEVLDAIAGVCAKYNLSWIIDAGTLIGAVRHKGFIPWDDDIDIVMPRDHYNRFFKVVQQELPDFIVTNIHTDSNWDEFHTVISNGFGYDLNQEFTEQYHGMPYAVGIDIFALDYLSTNLEEEKLRQDILTLVWRTIKASKSEVERKSDSFEAQIREIEELCKVTIPRDNLICHNLLVLFENLCCLYGESEAEEVGFLPFLIAKEKKRYKKSCLFELTEVDFCGYLLPAPKDWDTYLREGFGDYMRYVRNTGEHDYPSYLEKEQMLRGKISQIPYEYIFSTEHMEKQIVDKELKGGEKKRVAFLVYRYQSWKYMEKYYKEYCAKDDYIVDVVVSPYYIVDFLKYPQAVRDERELFDKSLSVIPLSEYDFEKIQPEVIFTHNTFDECNARVSIMPEVYSAKLKNCTKKLVYVPDFEIKHLDRDDYAGMYNTKFYITMPGVIHADEIILKSEHMRQLYIDVLTDFTGDDYREIWEKRVVVQ